MGNMMGTWRFRKEYTQDQEANESWGLPFYRLQKQFEKEQSILGYQYKVTELKPDYCRLVTHDEKGVEIAVIVITNDDLANTDADENLTAIFHEEAPYHVGYDIIGSDGLRCGAGSTNVVAANKFIAEYVAAKEHRRNNRLRTTIQVTELFRLVKPE